MILERDPVGGFGKKISNQFFSRVIYYYHVSGSDFVSYIKVAWSDPASAVSVFHSQCIELKMYNLIIVLL